MLVTAFGADPDGNPGTLLRVWEQAGVSGELTVTLPAGFKVTHAQPVNLRGEKIGEPVVVSGGALKFEPARLFARQFFAAIAVYASDWFRSVSRSARTASVAARDNGEGVPATLPLRCPAPVDAEVSSGDW